jgi:two-component system, OmpR family, response regulator MtrA
MGAKILLVDDDPDITSLLGGELESLGYEVTVCDNGEEVLPALRAFKPDLLITDVMLPGVDGYSLLNRIANEETLQNLPVIVMSALSTSRSMFETLPQVKAFFAKPFHPVDFLDAVKQAVAGR